LNFTSTDYSPLETNEPLNSAIGRESSLGGSYTPPLFDDGNL